MYNVWTQEKAVQLCCLIEAICPEFGYHVALTGGCLYKGQERKDCDILFYSIRQEDPDRDGLLEVLENDIVGLKIGRTFGWMTKATYHDKALDIFFPETSKSESDGRSGEAAELHEPEDPLAI